MLPHFPVLLSTDTEPVRLSHCSPSGSTWWGDKLLDSPKSLARSKTKDIGFLSTGRAYNEEQGVYLT